MSEEAMYNYIKDFLEKEKRCTSVLINEARFYYYKDWVIDVAGVKHAEIFGVEAKPSFDIYSVNDALEKARAYKKCCLYAYVCFLKESFDADPNLQKYLKEKIENEGIGLLLLDVDLCQEQAVAKRSLDIDVNLYYDVLTQVKVSELKYPHLSVVVKGARAFIIRDICYFIAKKREPIIEAALAPNFAVDIGRKEAYWKAQNPGTREAGKTLDVETLMDRRSTWALEAAKELGLIDIINGKVKLSPLGKCLAELTSPQEYGEPNLSRQVESFFYALSLQYPEIRVALDLLKRTKKMRWSICHCSKCGMKTWKLSFKPPIKPTDAIHFQEGKMFCGKCKSQLRSDELSLYHAVTQELGAAYYHSLVMWFNSEILPVKYDSRKGIVMSS